MLNKLFIKACICLFFIQNVFAEDVVSCNLIKIDPKGNTSSFCSGTFISENKFVTADHCLQVIKESSSFTHKVRCQGLKETLNILGHLSHPDNKNDNSTPYNDAAIIFTEPNPKAKNFPLIPKGTDMLSDIVKESCFFRGFSTNICDYNKGDECLRTKITPHTPESNAVIIETPRSCNIKTGKNCALSNYNFNPSERAPLMIGIPKEIHSSWGDSGAGLLCKTKDNRLILMGVLALGIHDYMFVSTINKREFLKLSIQTEGQLSNSRESIQETVVESFSSQ